MLTGTQIIYKAMGNLFPIANRKERCRICGGELPENAKICSASAAWTSENIINRIDQKFVCPACDWFMQEKNRLQIWNKGFGYIAAADRMIYTKTSLEFFHCLCNEKIAYPSVFMIKGSSQSIGQKHMQWKTINAVSYSPTNIKIIYSGIDLFFKSQSAYDCIAEISLQIFIDTVLKLTDQIEKYVVKCPQQRNKLSYCFPVLKEIYRDKMTPELMIACFFASEIIKNRYPSLSKKQKKGESNE